MRTPGGGKEGGSPKGPGKGPQGHQHIYTSRHIYIYIHKDIKQIHIQLMHTYSVYMHIYIYIYKAYRYTQKYTHVYICMHCRHIYIYICVYSMDIYIYIYK